MQVEVFRRAMERKQDELCALVEEETCLITLADDRLAPNALPTLPTEVIAQIFASLYFIEGPIGNIDANSTLQNFLDDSGTTEDWRHLIQREIPGVITSTGEDDMRVRSMVDEVKELLGPHPRLWPTDDLDAALSGSSTTVLATVNGWPLLEDRLHNLCKFPCITSSFQHVTLMLEIGG